MSNLAALSDSQSDLLIVSMIDAPLRIRRHWFNQSGNLDQRRRCTAKISNRSLSLLFSSFASRVMEFSEFRRGVFYNYKLWQFRYPFFTYQSGFRLTRIAKWNSVSSFRNSEDSKNFCCPRFANVFTLQLLIFILYVPGSEIWMRMSLRMIQLNLSLLQLRGLLMSNSYTHNKEDVDV